MSKLNVNLILLLVQKLISSLVLPFHGKAYSVAHDRQAAQILEGVWVDLILGGVWVEISL